MTRGLALLALAGALAACPIDAPPVDEPAPAPTVALDIVVNDAVGLVLVYIQPLDRSCRCSSRFLDEGTCGLTFTDTIGCSCDDGSLPTNRELLGCIDEVLLESNVGIDDVLVDDHGGGVVGGFGDGVSALVVKGCGGEARVPLDAGEIPLVSAAGDVRGRRDGFADARVEGTADRFQICVNGGFTEHCCDGGGRVEVPDVFGDVSLVGLNGPAVVDGPAGPIRVWHKAGVALGNEVVVPVMRADGLLEVSPVSFASWNIDGLDVAPDRLVFASESPTELLFQGPASDLVVTATETRVSFADDKGPWRGSFAALPVDLPVTLGAFSDIRVVVGEEIELMNEAEPTLTRRVPISVVLTMPSLAIP